MKVFGAAIGQSYDPLEEEEFASEKRMQEEIEENLETFFPNLVFVDSEFSIGGDRVDTVAYDNERDCFVIIEYKNTKSESVLNQCIAYQQKMKIHKTDLVLLFNKAEKKQYDTKDFDWDAAYVIIVAPKFTQYQLQGKDGLHNIELHQIHIHERGIIILEQLNGKPHLEAEEEEQQKEKEKLERPKNVWTEEERLSKASDEIKKLYGEIKKTLLSKNMTVKPTKVYIGFCAPNDRLVCSVVIRKQSKIILQYAITKSHGVLAESDFVKEHNTVHWGGGHYSSIITDRNDFERALPYIEKAYAHKGRV